MTAAVRQGPACSMQAEEGTGLRMIAPARGSSRYALVRDGVRRGYSVGLGGGSGIKLAGMTAMTLIIGRVFGGWSVALCDGGRFHFHVVLMEEFHEAYNVHVLSDVGEDPEWAMVLVNAVRQ